MVAFTFDDGPDYRNTPAILQALAEYAVPATFFVCGYRFGGKNETALKNRDLVKEIADTGHTLGNHTWNHPVLPTLKGKALASEIDRNAAAIAEISGVTSLLFRPPFGSLSRHVEAELAARNLDVVLWTIDSGDSQAPFTVSKVHHKVTKQLLRQEGGIVLFHDTHSWTRKAVPLVLADLENENCKRLQASKPLIEVVPLALFLSPDAASKAEVISARKKWIDTLSARCAAKIAGPPAPVPNPPINSPPGAKTAPKVDTRTSTGYPAPGTQR